MAGDDGMVLPRRRAVVWIVWGLLTASACRGDTPTQVATPDPVPVAAPRDTTPLEGLDRARLYRLADQLRAGRYGAVHSVIVQRNGVRIIEEYFRGQDSLTAHSMQSVSKSFASALLGIAIDKGFVEGVTERVMDFFPQWEEELGQNSFRSAMTLEHILTMRTGNDYNENGSTAPHWTLNRLTSGWDYFWLSRPMLRPPGTVWQYDSGGVIALSSVIKARTGDHANVKGASWLFEPLGMSRHSWFTNSEGHPHLGGGLWATPRDMIKLGQLYLQEGVWEGEQIVSREWVEVSTRRHVQFNNPPTAALPQAYGYLWWILRPDPDGAGEQDIYAAVGAGGQFVFVIPEHQMVVGVTSDVQTGQQWTPIEWLYSEILKAVLRGSG